MTDVVGFVEMFVGRTVEVIVVIVCWSICVRAGRWI
jgi:hypothetical protein